MIKIYVLKLENNKFYVGQSKNIDKRFSMHVKGKQSSDWTKLNRPIEIIYTLETNFTEIHEAMTLENYTTIKFMKQYGWRNVRGGDYCTLDVERLRFLLCANSDMGKEILPIEVNPNVALLSKTEQLFTLELKGNNYFIGRTNNIKLAILNEYNGLGSEWTKKYKPQKLLSILDVSKYENSRIRSLHNSLVINYMKKHDFRRVRGGDFYKNDERNHKNKVLNYTDIFKG
jgi:predicted GIY-YIG superfamily endonuclease